MESPPPETARNDARSEEALARIEARLERIERSLDRMQLLAEHAPGMGAMLVDAFDEWADQDGKTDERVRALARLAERISRPKTLATLEMLVERLEQAPQIVAMVTDIVDDMAARATDEGLDMGDLLEQVRAASLGLLRITTSPEVRELLESEMLATGAVQTLGHVAKALSSARQQPPRQAGVFAAMRALRDPDVQRALGLAIRVAKEFGGSLEVAEVPLLVESTS